jgi:hypothetical protein
LWDHLIDYHGAKPWFVDLPHVLIYEPNGRTLKRVAGIGGCAVGLVNNRNVRDPDGVGPEEYQNAPFSQIPLRWWADPFLRERLYGLSGLCLGAVFMDATVCLEQVKALMSMLDKGDDVYWEQALPSLTALSGWLMLNLGPDNDWCLLVCEVTKKHIVNAVVSDSFEQGMDLFVAAKQEDGRYNFVPLRPGGRRPSGRSG